MLRFARSLPDHVSRSCCRVPVRPPFLWPSLVVVVPSHQIRVAAACGCSNFSTESWKPGKKRPVANDLDEEEDEDEKEKRLEYEKQRAAFLGQQKRMNEEADAAADKKKQEEEQEKANAAKQQQQQQRQQEQQQQQQQQQQRQSNYKSNGPSIFSQLPFSKKSSSSSSSSSSTADASHPSPSVEVPLAPPSASAAAGGKLPDLKIQLRRFFRQIHPDLFESHPIEKEQNAKSLALLTDFLDTLRGGNASGLPRGSRDRQGKTAQVVFWVRAKEKESKPGDNVPPPTGATFYKISSTLAINTVAHHGTNQLYSSLSSLFKQAGLLHANNWAWGDEYDAASKASAKNKPETEATGEPSKPADPFASPFGNYNDEYFAQFASAAEGAPFGNTGELERYVRSIRAHSAHYEHMSRVGKHELLFRMTNLRLQGIKLIFEDETWEMQTQRAILDVYEKVLQQSKHFKPPNRVRTGSQHAEDPSDPSSSRFQSAGGAYANDPGTPNKPAQPNMPFSQTVSVPEGFASMFAQIKKHQIREGAETKPATATAAASQTSSTGSPSPTTYASQSAAPPKTDFESTRSPFSRVSSLFSLRHHSSHVDGRGRLIFSLHESESAWINFINSDPALIDRALALQKNYKALKVLEKQVADSLGLFDVFCDSSLIAQPRPSDVGVSDASNSKAATLGIEAAYMQFLTRVQQEAHLFHQLRQLFPSTSEISLRVFQPSSEYAASPTDSPSADTSLVASAFELIDVDPVMGMLLVPAHASLADIRRAILERGQECVQVKKMHVEDLSDYTNSLLHAKRHLKLRSLVPASTITRDQMREATERLSRTFGALRDLLQATSIVVGDQYELEEDGTICIPWNWS